MSSSADNSSEGGLWIITTSKRIGLGCRTRSGLQGSGWSPIKPICSDETADSSDFCLLARAANSSSNRVTLARVPIVLFRHLDGGIYLQWTKMRVVRPSPISISRCILSPGMFGGECGLILLIKYRPSAARPLIFQVSDLGPDRHANWPRTRSGPAY